MNNVKLSIALILIQKARSMFQLGAIIYFIFFFFHFNFSSRVSQSYIFFPLLFFSLLSPSLDHQEGTNKC